MNAGAYGPMHEVSAEELKIFKKAMHGLVGVNYEPETVATQVVKGTNYKYICNATVVAPDAKTFKAEVIIYMPLQGDPVIFEIKRL